MLTFEWATTKEIKNVMRGMRQKMVASNIKHMWFNDIYNMQIHWYDLLNH